MLKRAELILKAVCLALAMIVFYQMIAFVARPDPLKNLKFPSALSASAADEKTAAGVTNAVPRPESNSSPSSVTAPAPMGGGIPASASPPSPVAVAIPPGSRPAFMPPMLGPGAMMAFPGPGMGVANLPPEIQARVERIKDSEILGPVPRPLPMALLGIAGKDVFLRAPNGQTGLLREGEALGGVKLLRIGTNRVVVEHEGQQQELTVFAGFGSEPLLLKPKENPQ